MTTACSELPFTTAFHSDLIYLFSPGQPVILVGYAGGGKRKRRNTRKKTRKKKYIKKKTKGGGNKDMTQLEKKEYDEEFYYGRILAILEGLISGIRSDESIEATIKIYCARGGMRSLSVAWLLEKYNLKNVILSGGYKSYR